MSDTEDQATPVSALPSAVPRPAPGGYPWTFLLIAALIAIGVTTVGFRTTIGGAGLLLELVFIAYFVRHLAFVISALRTGPLDIASPDVDSGWRPPVTVIVACHNEAAVIGSLAGSLTALDYPADRLQIVLVDDGSTDGTADMIDQLALENEHFKALHRPLGRGGGKSAALNEGLEVATGEVIVVFDADHRPHADVIWRLARHFADPSVGAAQGRCAIYNGTDSPLAKLVAIDYLGGYLVNEYGRQSIYALPAYGGANCAVRADNLRAVGGWNPASVTDDTDLTLRLVLMGKRVRYDVTAVDEEEGVITLGQFWRQRYRWARGHQQVWREYRNAVWTSKFLSFGQKIETTMFLLTFHLPALSLGGLLVSGVWLADGSTPIAATNLFVLWMLLFMGPLLEFSAGLILSGSDRRSATLIVFFMPLFLISMALCTKAWIDGVAGRPYSWVKTPRSSDLFRAA